ncbi:MAG: hypothetical protein J5850_06675, partial [Clostridia bacterium]|nr:hypothetical protein [Clostridia bacterium]
MDQISKIVIVGAGKTGRGFLARLINGNEIIFIDKNKELVDALNVEKKFDVFFFGNDHSPVTVGFSEAMTWENVDSRLFDGAEVVLVSVGGNNLADVGIELKKYINKDNKIIVCENASSPAKKLYDSIGIDGLKISESTVFCTTIEKEKGTLAINSEWYPYLQYDSYAFGGNVIDINGLKAVSNFSGFLDRKLYTYNSASCIIAYLGALKGYSLYSDAANDPEILGLLDRNYEIINECICKEYGYD